MNYKFEAITENREDYLKNNLKTFIDLLNNFYDYEYQYLNIEYLTKSTIFVC